MAEGPRDVPPANGELNEITRIWRGLLGNIKERTLRKKHPAYRSDQEIQDKRDALLYETRKRLRREGWIR